ncbi:MAG: hypothetical protein J7577_11505 [Sphingobacteriaceae bacterium]|nr:hypothetical protein [Sphingobacteriaceae bacterium]
MSRFKFFEEEDGKSNIQVPEVVAKVELRDEKQANCYAKRYRYRIEQTLIMKMNGMIVSHGLTKQEYLMQKNFEGEKLKSLGFELVENVLQFNPKQLETGIELICELDKIKSLVDIVPNVETGKMTAIANKNKAVQAWKAYKEVIAQKFSFVKSQQEKESIASLVELMENQLNNDMLLLGDYESRIFYDLIFDKYLLGKNNFDPFEKNYLSNLFPQALVLLKVAPIVKQKNETSVNVKQVGVLDKESVDTGGFTNFYNDNYKPQVGYSFSTYNYSILSNYEYDIVDHVINEADVTITEEVKNNIEVIIDYRLKRIEL